MSSWLENMMIFFCNHYSFLYYNLFNKKALKLVNIIIFTDNKQY